MPGISDIIGPITEKNLRAIKEKIECCGRLLGIPEDQAATLIEIVEISELRAQNERIHQDRAQGKKEGFHLVRKIVSSINGILKSEE